MSCALYTRRFAGELSKLRERCEADCKCNLAGPEIDILQESARFFEVITRNVLDKICAADLLETLSNGMITIA
jgi:hypothetical protein